jgi:hypothetical protein
MCRDGIRGTVAYLNSPLQTYEHSARGHIHWYKNSITDQWRNGWSGQAPKESCLGVPIEYSSCNFDKICAPRKLSLCYPQTLRHESTRKGIYTVWTAGIDSTVVNYLYWHWREFTSPELLLHRRLLYGT